MAQRSKQIFIRPDEFLHLLDELRASWQVIVKSTGQACVVWTGNREQILEALYIFLTDATMIEPDALTDRYASARLGWVMMGIPRIVGDQLFLIQVGARGDWFDGSTGVAHNNLQALKQFTRLWKVMTARLQFSMSVRNVIADVVRIYPSIGYSDGAAEWFLRGNRLCQEGVKNIEFSIAK